MIQTNFRALHKATSVLIVDDHPIVRTGVRALLECTPMFEVVGDADNCFDAIRLAEAVQPDIVVTDLSMSHGGGIESIVELRRRVPGVEIVVFTLHRSDLLLSQAIKAGARAYVCKSETDHLIPALRAAARREFYYSPSLGEAPEQESGDEAWDRRPLTMRERQIVTLVAEGCSNKAISRLLRISVKTIETHRAAAMRKTHTNSAASLTLYAARNNLVKL